tara:strand:- start:499 stop:2361 length:1863 start_codon:yes stop_codon:yes gene_type:complete
MCGIAGIINFIGKNNSNTVEEMLQSINFRGPDFKTTLKGEFYNIGVARLSINDLSNKGNQPFYSIDRNIIAIYNGEIYNFKSIKKKFFSNHNFTSSCDGEIIPLLYQRFGIDFVKHLKGMFSICIIDKKNKCSILIRDRFGIKPLYFHHDGKENTLTFGSEIHVLLKNKKIKKKQNFFETARYLGSGLLNATNQTWFQDIYQLEPGQILNFSNNKIKFQKYYDLKNNVDESVDKKKSNYFTLEKNIFSLIETSLHEHAISDQTIGLHISGGNDSACLAAGCKKINLPTQCFTFDFKEKNFSEKEDALKISKKLGYDHSFSLIDNSDLISEFEKVIKIQFEPFTSLRVVAQNYLYEKYKESCKVIFDGCGGDEIGAGYNYHQVAWMHDMVNDGYKNSKKKIFKHLSDYETINKDQIIAGSIKKLSNNLNVHEDGSVFDNSKVLNLNALLEYKNDYTFKKPFKSILRNAQFTDLVYKKIPRTLRYADRASMRCSVETRIPLLDHKLVEAMFSIPTKFKYIRGYQRFILKRFCQPELSKEMVFKNKRPIADPQSVWLKTVFKEYVLDILNSKIAKEDEFIVSKELIKLFDELLKSKSHFNTFFLFQSFNYLVWKNNIMNNTEF